MRGKPSVDRIKLIQSVMSDQINPTSADDAAAFMHEIAAIAFDGYFAGGGAYLNFGVGSWLDGKLTVLLLRAGKLSQSSFVKVLIGVGADKSLDEWKNVVDGYLILQDLPCYKSNLLPELPLEANEIWRVAYDLMHREWWPKAHNGQLISGANFPILPVTSSDSPRSVLARHFASDVGELPIQGGWGYTQEDSIIIDKYDPVVDRSVPFNGIRLEKIIAELRISEELVFSRPLGHCLMEIKWSMTTQRLHCSGDKSYDRLTFEISAFHATDWIELKSEYEGPYGYGTPGFDVHTHEQKREERRVRFTRDFWYDITSFFGDN